MRAQKSTVLAIFSLLLMASLGAGCKKDNFTTKPQLKFLNAKNYTVPFGGFLEFSIEFTDKEGDLSDSIFVQKLVPDCPGSNFTSGYPMPVFPESANLKGEARIVFTHGVVVDGYAPIGGPTCGRDDIATFRFWIKDKAKNVSDTITSDRPITLKVP